MYEKLYNDKANIGHASLYNYVDAAVFGGPSNTWTALEAAYQNTLHRVQMNYLGALEKYSSNDNGASWINEGAVPTFVSYEVPLENGWGGNLTVITSRNPRIAILVGVLDPASATSDKFANAGAGYDECNLIKIPVQHQGTRLFVNQDLINIKITFSIDASNQWIASIDRSTIGAPVSICNIYAAV